MSAIKKLIISLIVIIGILAVVLISVYIVARVNLGVDLFRTVGQLKTLSQPVNEQESFPAAYRSEDLAELKSQTDSQLGDVVLYEEGKGYEGYTVDFTALALSGVTAKPVFLSEQQAGALAEIVFHQQTGGVLTIADKEISVCVLQIAFTEIDAETGNADLNVTVKLDLTPFKNDMKGFPFNLLKGFVPDTLYVTSVVRIEKERGLPIPLLLSILRSTTFRVTIPRIFPYAGRRLKNWQRGRAERGNRNNRRKRPHRYGAKSRFCLCAESNGRLGQFRIRFV